MSDAPRYVVSACLAGVFSRYDGSTQALDPVLELIRQGRALPVCPEQLGGLGTPRPPCEIAAGRVLDKDGADRTAEFARGAAEALRLARLFGATRAVLKARSPSCGSGVIYDGSFSGRRVPGDGLFAAALRAAGIAIQDEEEFAAGPAPERPDPAGEDAP